MEISNNDNGSMRPCSRRTSLRCSLVSNAFLRTDMVRVCLAADHLLSCPVSVPSRELLPRSSLCLKMAGRLLCSRFPINKRQSEFSGSKGSLSTGGSQHEGNEENGTCRRLALSWVRRHWHGQCGAIAPLEAVGSREGHSGVIRSKELNQWGNQKPNILF